MSTKETAPRIITSYSIEAEYIFSQKSLGHIGKILPKNLKQVRLGQIASFKNLEDAEFEIRLLTAIEEHRDWDMGNFVYRIVPC